MRQRIIDVAIEETGEKGIKFTMNDLARRLGVSKRTLYENFGSKEELIEAIIQNFFTRIKEKEEDIVKDPNLNPVEKLKKMAMILPNNFRHVYLSRFYEMRRYYPKQWEKMKEWLKDWKPEEELIREGIEKGELREVNLTVLRKIVFESMVNLLDQSFLIKNDITFKETLESMIDLLLYGLVREERK